MAPTPDPFEDTTALLVALVGCGFRFAHHRDASGDLLAIQGVRVHDNVIDVVVLRGEDEAKAVRMPGDEQDILAPTTTLWRTTGRAQTVLARVLDLADESASANAAHSATEDPWAEHNPEVSGVVLDQDQAPAAGVAECGTLLRSRCDVADPRRRVGGVRPGR